MMGGGVERSDPPGDRSAQQKTLLRSIASIAALTVIYFIAGKLSLQWAFLSRSASPVWAPTGISLAAMLFLGYRIWPAVWVGAFLVNVTTAGSLLTSIGIATGNTLEALIGAALVMRFANGSRAFETSRDVLRFLLFAAILGPAVSATFGVTSLEFGGFEAWTQYLPVWGTWWLGDTVSAIVITPLIVVWCAPPHDRWSRREVGEALLMLALVLANGFVVFAGVLPPPFHRYPIAFLTVPALVWATLRFGQRGASTGSFALSGVALWGTLEGFGPFALDHPNDSLIVLQAFIGTIAVTILLLGAAISERRRQQAALRVSEASERARALEMDAVMAAAPAMIWIAKDPDCHVITGNPASYEFLRVGSGMNLSKSGPEGERLPYAVFQDGRELRPEELPLHRAARGEVVRDCELEVRLANGGSRYILGNATTLRNGEGRRSGAVGVFVDITLRKETQRALRESQERLEGLILSAMDAIVAVDDRERVVLFNPAAERMFGCPASEVLGRPLDRFMPSRIHEANRDHIAVFAREGIANRRMGTQGALSAVRANGEEFPIEASVSQVEVGGQKLFTVILRDITERTRAEAELAASRRELETRVEERTAELKEAHEQLVSEMDERARLESEMTGIVERERHRLGQELHEGLSQQMAGTGILLSVLEARLKSISSPLADEALHLQSLIAQSVDRAQSLARGFYPVELEGFGLLAALEEIATNNERSSGIECTVETDGSPCAELKGPLAIQVFRIAQEAMHNAVTHSGARKVLVRLTMSESAVKLTVEDDGQGFPPDRDDTRGTGLRIMRYRSQLVGGRFEFRNGPRGGAIVSCSVPYPD